MSNIKRIAGFAVGFIIVFLIIQIFSSTDKLPPFKEFRSTEGRFTVLMPGKPKRERQNADTAVGKVETIMFTAGPRKAVCIVAYSDYPEALISRAVPDKVLDGARDGAVNNINGKLISEKNISFHGLPARDLQIEIPNKAFVNARLILKSPRFYQLMFIAPTNKSHEQDITKFFDSFKIDGVE